MPILEGLRVWGYQRWSPGEGGDIWDYRGRNASGKLGPNSRCQGLKTLQSEESTSPEQLWVEIHQGSCNQFSGLHPPQKNVFSATPTAYESSPSQGSNPSWSHDLPYRCSNAGSLTHCAGLGLELVPPQRQVGSLTHCTTTGTPQDFFKKRNRMEKYKSKLHVVEGKYNFV